IEAIVRASAVAHLVNGHWERLQATIRQVAKEHERQQHEARWLDPPTAEELLLIAVVGRTRERGAWRASPIQQVVAGLTDCGQREPYPMPPGWPRSGRELGSRMRTIRRRLPIAGVAWRRGRVTGWYSNGVRPNFYEFVPWDKGVGTNGHDRMH